MDEEAPVVLHLFCISPLIISRHVLRSYLHSLWSFMPLTTSMFAGNVQRTAMKPHSRKATGHVDNIRAES